MSRFIQIKDCYINVDNVDSFNKHDELNADKGFIDYQLIVCTNLRHLFIFDTVTERNGAYSKLKSMVGVL